MNKPLALIIDDDEDFNKILKVFLAKLGLKVETTASPADFLKKLKTAKPSICLIDLNIGELGVGYTIIKAVRSVLGPDLPLLVVSSLSDRQSIAHALELGANDFIVKPVQAKVLSAKLARFVDSEELKDSKQPFIRAPLGGVPAHLDIDMLITDVDEFGVRVLSPHLLVKGTVVYLDNDLVQQITCRAQPVLMTVTSTWVESDQKRYGVALEFDQTDEQLKESVRRWLVET